MCNSGKYFLLYAEVSENVRCNGTKFCNSGCIYLTDNEDFYCKELCDLFNENVYGIENQGYLRNKKCLKIFGGN